MSTQSTPQNSNTMNDDIEISLHENTEQCFDVAIECDGTEWVLAYWISSRNRAEDGPDAVAVRRAPGARQEPATWRDVPARLLQVADQAAKEASL